MDFYRINEKKKRNQKRQMRGLVQSGSVPSAYHRHLDIREAGDLLFPGS